MIKGKPFVKWAGGKRQIIDKLKQYVPDDYLTYYEPFIGGGALFFELSPKNAVINDSNFELMNVYKILCDHEKYTKMCSVLNNYDKNHNEEFFYEIWNKDRHVKTFN
ncbi:MAG: DNA adenine methylase, partial [Malacoplasma sp.]